MGLFGSEKVVTCASLADLLRMAESLGIDIKEVQVCDATWNELVMIADTLPKNGQIKLWGIKVIRKKKCRKCQQLNNSN